MSHEFKAPKFVSENTIEEQKKAREDKGLEEAPYDPRTLYERLEEQRKLKEEAYAEATKLGNQIHRIDDDESEFLIELIENEKRKKTEIEKAELEALRDFKKKVAQKISEPVPNQPPDTNPTTNQPTVSNTLKVTQLKPNAGKGTPKSQYEKKVGKLVQVKNKPTEKQQLTEPDQNEPSTGQQKKLKLNHNEQVQPKPKVNKGNQNKPSLLVDYYSDSE